ncbi:hypothetical protein BD410DRAFT_757430 [Rickenella mellea]|uniref:P-loop containing nucleoside triphosphate hydrolase protein n=1 Tax=Rickenella mellea TaxID=50990 RepID=A0A4Y7PEW6_9AGAM|nr:hypothetical protein BD410DRAFT_757430 [Rickenella mellea]
MDMLNTTNTISSAMLDTLRIPGYFAAISAIVLSWHIVVASGPGKRLIALILSQSDEPVAVSPSGVTEDTSAQECTAFRSRVFVFQVLRLTGSVALLGLTLATLGFIPKSNSETSSPLFTNFMENFVKAKYNHVSGNSGSEMSQIAVLLAYVYTSLLAGSILLRPIASPWSKTANRHLAAILLVAFLVFTYRDVWPLLTFTDKPADAAEGWLLWSKLTVLCVTAVFIPLLMPREYIPVDPQNPAPKPNPEQTTPLLSLLMFSFLDPLVWRAYKTPHLSLDDHLPPLADYDRTPYLVDRAFKNLDSFSGAKKRHLFFGLMKTFRREYIELAFMTLLRVLTAYASPIGVKQLLLYVEQNGEGAYVRPWVWISWLFLGPFIGAVVMQRYIFIGTGTVVRVEAIITQLVFEHALRMRMKGAGSDIKGSGGAVTHTTSATESSARVGTPLGDDADDDSIRESSNGRSVTASSSTPKSASNRTRTIGKESLPEVPAQGDHTLGKLNNMVTTDLKNISGGRDFLLCVIYGALGILLSGWFLYSILGWSAMVGMIVMVLGFPLPGYTTKLIQKFQVEKMKKTDARVQLVAESMNILRLIKFFGWEEKINAQIAEKCEDELKYVLKGRLLDILNNIINYVIPLITMIASYSTYTIIMKGDLTASTVFSSIAVFDLLRSQLQTLFYMIPPILQAKVSLNRVTEFLQEIELLDKYAVIPDSRVPGSTIQGPDMENVIGFRDATFAWSTHSEIHTRRNFRLCIEGELHFRRGGFNLIIGPTGSGKTALLMALLGEMHFIPSDLHSSFNLPRGGGVAYAAQEAWVQNDTIKDNILFGSPFVEERYKKVIYQCGLEPDLAFFETGDDTEVGEKGLTLSGGQKARITLARAIYSPAEIILLDDVLAALDVHTARWIVDKCFQGDQVKGRTVLLVTHNIVMTTQLADFVVVIGRNGHIASQGTADDVLVDNYKLVDELGEAYSFPEKSGDDVEDKPLDVKVQKLNGKLTVAEEASEGHVNWKAMKLYLNNLGTPLFWFAFFSGVVLSDASNTIQVWWLGYWALQYEGSTHTEVSIPFYLIIYAIFAIISIVLYSFGFTMYMFGSIRASRVIHRKLVGAVTRTTLQWLDTTPTARIIARCTQDINAVDGPVSHYLSWLCELTITMMVKFGAVILFTPIFLFPGIALAIFGCWCGQVYIQAQLTVKREMSNARSPVLSHFGAAVEGIVSIRAYGCQTSFKNDSMIKIDRYTRAARTFNNLDRWINIRLEPLGGLYAAALAAWLIYRRNLSKANDIGFSLDMAVGFSSLILLWVKVLNELEINGDSLERIQDYVSIEQEPKSTASGVPPAYWPASGDMRVENLSASYSFNGPKVLKDISFHIKSGQRVGVVGRTGSGKSSLILSLLRCIYTEGNVYYDSVLTSSVNLDVLRSNITIIPQVPELLSASVRHNLDPFGEHDDATLNNALRSAGLFSFQKDDDDVRITLESSISSGGANLSVGQRQILALARALVRGSKLLILDEATSAIDYETDTIIQKSLREELKGDVTLITVAHRLQTIMDADKILVLDAGKVLEFDSPSELLKKDGGLLKSLVDESGDSEKLYAMAHLEHQNLLNRVRCPT